MLMVLTRVVTQVLANLMCLFFYQRNPIFEDGYERIITEKARIFRNWLETLNQENPALAGVTNT